METRLEGIANLEQPCPAHVLASYVVHLEWGAPKRTFSGGGSNGMEKTAKKKSNRIQSNLEGKAAVL